MEKDEACVVPHLERVDRKRKKSGGLWHFYLFINLFEFIAKRKEKEGFCINLAIYFGNKIK